jgi:hypothetical protein
MRANTWKLPVLCLAAAQCLIVLAQPAVADQEVEADKKVQVKVIKCQEGDCEEMIENLIEGENAEIMVGDDMAKKIVIRKVHCDGENCEEHEGLHKMVMVGDHGDVEVMAGDGGHSWISHHGGFGGGGYLGVGLTELTPELREHFGVPAGAGVMVSKVMDDSPAFRAGLEAGDIIASVDGDKVADGSTLAEVVRSHEDGEEVVLDVWRDGVAKSITAAVEERTDMSGMRHMKHMGHMKGMKNLHKIMIRCDSDEEDCEPNIEIAGLEDFDCGDSEECKVKVECRDDGCTCSINGEEADCAGIPGVPGQ